MLSMLKSEKFKLGQISSTYFKTLTELSSESNLLRARRARILVKAGCYMYSTVPKVKIIFKMSLLFHINSHFFKPL